MKRMMVWMWEHPVEAVDERGRPIKKTELRPYPCEDCKRQRVAWYREPNE